ncbi:MAG TPA: amidohydrolase family protein [Anaerolineae bacterium]|nr:amidohydrolase family protein [Anaerolineae bacterium]
MWSRSGLGPGKLADIVVLSRDTFTGPPEAILDTVVDLAIVGGRVVYER